MNGDQFEKVQKLIHYNDNYKHLPWEEADHDRLHKLWCIIGILKNNFGSIPFEQNLSLTNNTKLTLHKAIYVK